MVVQTIYLEQGCFNINNRYRIGNLQAEAAMPLITLKLYLQGTFVEHPLSLLTVYVTRNLFLTTCFVLPIFLTIEKMN